MQQSLEQFLQSMGLNSKQSKLYIAALKSGPQTASVLARRTGFSRSTVGFLFEELVKKGFASKSRSESTTHYTVVQPESLQYFLQERVAREQKLMADYQDLLPFFNQLQNTESPLPKVRAFEGVQGLCNLIQDIYSEDVPGLFISEHSSMHPKIKDFVLKNYLPAARAHKHKKKMIISKTPQAEAYVKRAKGTYDEIFFVDPKEFPFSHTTVVYGNKVAFCSYNPADLTGVIIENKLIADQIRTVFGVLKKYFAGR